jgi:cytochrome c oxidase assembly protein subunit 15
VGLSQFPFEGSSVRKLNSRMPPAPNRGINRFAVGTAIFTLLPLAAGALVTSNDAGLAVPDWPLSYGTWMPPMVGGIFYEHGHRMIAATVGFLTVILAVWIQRREPRAWVRKLGWTALGLVIAQGLLGGLTVLLLLPPVVSSAHATLAQLYFCTIATLAVVTSNWWQSDLPTYEDTGSPSLKTVSLLCSIVIVIQTILGAAFRHGAFGIWPHIVWAGAVSAMVVWTGIVVKRRFREVRPLRKSMIFLHAFFGTQILLGGVTYWVVLGARNDPQPLPLFVSVTVAHVVMGALTLAASVMVMLTAIRLVKTGAMAHAAHGTRETGRHAEQGAL